MASFFEDLWTSVFTPGPTPTLLLATNATFAMLQILLFALLVATFSIHFLVLSVLCGGLWVAINWFARELMAAQAEEKAQKEKEEAQKGETEAQTEVEAEGSKTPKRTGKGKTTGTDGSEVRRRMDDSTDGEWEKVERER